MVTREKSECPEIHRQIQHHLIPPPPPSTRYNTRNLLPLLTHYPQSNFERDGGAHAVNPSMQYLAGNCLTLLWIWARLHIALPGNPTASSDFGRSQVTPSQNVIKNSPKWSNFAAGRWRIGWHGPVHVPSQFRFITLLATMLSPK